MDFFEKVGKVSLGSRLRILSERMMEDAAQVYQQYEVDMQPKWFPVMCMLSEKEEMGVTDIARSIRHSHPSVSKMAREMKKAGLISMIKDKQDKRRSLVSLTEKGKEVATRLADQMIDVDSAVGGILSESTYDIWKAVGELEYLLDQKNIYYRVMDEKKKRERANVQIVAYEPKYKNAFKKINEAWIDQYFELEDEDRKLLDNPQKNILDKNGFIFIALYKGEPVGTCALVPIDDPHYDYEIGKMGVEPRAQGLGIGWRLGEVTVEKAKALGCKKLYLESNTVLAPAIRLYEKMGFKKITGHPSPYARCNIQMELDITD